MREQLYACEQTFLVDYLSRMENASEEELRLAASMFGEKDDEEQDDIYEEDGDEARIKIDGPISMGGPSPLARLFGFGGTSYKDIIAACRRAEAGPCSRVTLQINSPGGEVAGVDQCWQAIRSLSASKPCTAENHGLMASAAYWLASSCTRIKAMSPACEQGSIGVLIVGIDDTGAGEKLGIKRVSIVSRNAPKKDSTVATKAGRSALQERADAMEGVFLARVAEGRRTSPEDVAENFGQGAVLIASEALRVGMIDSVQSEMSVPDSASRKVPGGMVAEAILQAPFPNFHACRLAEPSGEKTRYAKGDREHEGKKYDVIYQQKKGSDSWEEQSYRYPKGSWDAKEAAAHCRSHKGRFEAAKDTKGETMKLSELLAENSEARQEYEKALADAREAGVRSVQARIDAAKPFLALQAKPDGYDAAEVAQIAKFAVDVIAGSEDPGALRGFVRLVDMQVEKRKQAAAEAETAETGETPPVKLEEHADLMAKAAALKIDVKAVEAAALAAKTDPLEALRGEIALQEVAQRGAKPESRVRGL
jgi:ClpP class serine protease